MRYNKPMAKREAAFTTRFKKWLHQTIGPMTAAAYEIKVTTSKSIPFDALKPHQLAALENVNKGRFIYKIPDAGWQNPFDVFHMSHMDAFVVLGFITKGKSQVSVWMITIDGFMEAMDYGEEMGFKSLNETTLLSLQEKMPCEFTHHIV